MNRTLSLVAAVILSLTSATRAEETTIPTGMWDAWLESPGGRLPFQLELGSVPSLLEPSKSIDVAFIINGRERIDVPVVRIDRTRIELRFDYYDSQIEATYSFNQAGLGHELKGAWTKRRNATETVTMKFGAYQLSGITPCPMGIPREVFSGRWRMKFESDADLAVGQIETRQGHLGGVLGTIETTTGDYRYLAGSANGDNLTLSTFDGAHAFLFKAALQPDGSMKGDFWSGPSFHDTFTAVRDDNAKLPDAFTLTKAAQPDASASLAAMSFPDLEGKPRSLADPAFAGKARIIELFGTWCPNCRDATHLLTELDGEYREKGLSILALAFEVTGDAERDRKQARLYADRHAIKYPILIAGVNKKDLASAAFPIIDKLRAYPTFVFLDRRNHVRAVYTGFSGPATGPEHDRLKQQFRALIEEILRDE